MMSMRCLRMRKVQRPFSRISLHGWSLCWHRRSEKLHDRNDVQALEGRPCWCDWHAAHNTRSCCISASRHLCLVSTEVDTEASFLGSEYG